jgi:hypothetical protein
MNSASVRLTQVPPRPSCSDSVFSSASCQDRWRLYNQAAHQVSAPLQQQIEELNKLTADQQAQIKVLSDQIQADSTAAFQAKVDSATALKAKDVVYTEGLQQGVGIGMGAALPVALIFGIRRLTRQITVTKKPQARAASA